MNHIVTQFVRFHFVEASICQHAYVVYILVWQINGLLNINLTLKITEKEVEENYVDVHGKFKSPFC